MTDQATIFNKEQQQPAEAAPATTEATPAPTATADPYVEALQQITDADGKPKYSNVEDALKSISFANDHISKIEAENAEIRRKLAETKAAEDLVAQIQQASNPQTSGDKGVSMEAITTLVDQAITAKDQQKRVQHNQQSVAARLTERFGEKAEEMYLSKGRELGLGPQTLNEIAGTSPEAVLAWFGDVTQKANPPTIKSTVINNGAVTPHQEEKKSVMGMTSDTELRAEWDRIKKQVEADFAA